MNLTEAATYLRQRYGLELAPGTLQIAAWRGSLKAANTRPGSNRGEWLVTEAALDAYVQTSQKLRGRLTTPNK